MKDDCGSDHDLAELMGALIRADLAVLGKKNKNGHRQGTRGTIDPLVLKYAVQTYQKIGETNYKNLRLVRPGLPALSTIQAYRSRFQEQRGTKTQVLVREEGRDESMNTILGLRY